MCHKRTCVRVWMNCTLQRHWQLFCLINKKQQERRGGDHIVVAACFWKCLHLIIAHAHTHCGCLISLNLLRGPTLLLGTFQEKGSTGINHMGATFFILPSALLTHTDIQMLKVVSKGLGKN